MASRKEYHDLQSKVTRPTGARNDEDVLQRTGLYRAICMVPEDPPTDLLPGPTAWLIFTDGVPTLRAWNGQTTYSIALTQDP